MRLSFRKHFANVENDYVITKESNSFVIVTDSEYHLALLPGAQIINVWNSTYKILRDC